MSAQSLIKACESGNVAAARAALEAGVSPTCTIADHLSRYFNWLPVHTAIFNGQKEVVALLLSHPGVDVNQPTLNPQRTTPQHIAAWHCPSMVPLLLEHGTAVNARDAYGQTPLHDAAFHGHADAVSALLSTGADAGLRNSRGLRAVDRARAKGRATCVVLLSEP